MRSSIGGSSLRLLLYDRKAVAKRHYDSFGNLKQYANNSVYYNFIHDDQNRITAAYGKRYGYDTVGRLSSYEGSSQTVHKIGNVQWQSLMAAILILSTMATAPGYRC